MRAATAQRCFNPAGGRLSSLSRLRAPCKPPGQPLSPLSCSMRLSPGFGGFSKPPWVAVPGAQPQSGPRSSSHVGSLGCRLPPCGAGVAQGWQVACGGKERFKQLLSWAHTLFWEELDACKYSQGALWGGEGSTGVASSRVCVCGGCVCIVSRPGANPAFGCRDVLCGFTGRCSWLAAQLLPHGRFSRTSLSS